MNKVNTSDLFEAMFKEGEQVVVIDEDDKFHWGKLTSWNELSIRLTRTEGTKILQWEDIVFISHDGFPVRKLPSSGADKYIEEMLETPEVKKTQSIIRESLTEDASSKGIISGGIFEGGVPLFNPREHLTCPRCGFSGEIIPSVNIPHQVLFWNRLCHRNSLHIKCGCGWSTERKALDCPEVKKEQQSQDIIDNYRQHMAVAPGHSSVDDDYDDDDSPTYAPGHGPSTGLSFGDPFEIEKVSCRLFNAGNNSLYHEYYDDTFIETLAMVSEDGAMGQLFTLGTIF